MKRRPQLILRRSLFQQNTGHLIDTAADILKMVGICPSHNRAPCLNQWTDDGIQVILVYLSVLEQAHAGTSRAVWLFRASIPASSIHSGFKRS